MVKDRAQQLLPCRRCSLDWCLWPFLSPFYTIFWSPSPLKPSGYCICLIMMKHVAFSPNLSAVAWYVLHNDLRDLRTWRKCKLAFPYFRLALLGMGLQQRISKWISNGWALWLLYLLDNDETRTFLTQPLHHRIDSFTRNVHRDLQARRTCKLAGTSAAWTLKW